MADQHVLDRCALRMAEMQRAGDVGRRLDDRERLCLRVGGRAGAVRRKHVGREPSVVDGSLEIGRSIGLRELGRLRFGGIGHLGPGIERPARPADERGRGTTSWFEVRCRPLITDAGSGPPRRRAIGRRPHGSRVTSRLRARTAHTVPRSLRGRWRALLLSVHVVEWGV